MWKQIRKIGIKTVFPVKNRSAVWRSGSAGLLLLAVKGHDDPAVGIHTGGIGGDAGNLL